jgi:hypothetical protein
LLGAKEWCGVVRVEVWVAKIRAKGKVLWEMILVILSVTLMSPTHRPTSVKWGCHQFRIQKICILPTACIYIFRATSEQAAIISLQSTDSIIQRTGSVFTARYGLKL